jgi:hypothetical protein
MDLLQAGCGFGLQAAVRGPVADDSGPRTMALRDASSVSGSVRLEVAQRLFGKRI